MLAVILIAFSSAIAAMYYYLTMYYDYWEKKGVVYIKPEFPYGTNDGHLKGLKDIGSATQSYYHLCKKLNLKFIGGHLVRQPHLLVIDLDLCKHILTKDFQHFVARDVVPVTHEFLSKHLFSLEGLEWRNMRKKLSPVFTSGRIKSMFALVERCAEQLEEYIEDVVLKDVEFDVKNLMLRFTTDTIATCAFGFDINSLVNPDNEFYKMGQMIFIPSRIIILKFYIQRNFPSFARFMKFRFLNQKVPDYLLNLVKNMIDYRVKHNVIRNDFIDLFRNLRNSFDNGSEEIFNDFKNEKFNSTGIKTECLSMEEITAQAFVFLSAGLETSASTISFCLYELAKHPELQAKLQHEIDAIKKKHGGKLTYQAMQEMTYLDQVVYETLRRYSSFPVLTRVCTEPYQIPNTNIVLDKGVRVTIPIYAIQHDPDIYPDPYEFNPDRFTEDAIKERHSYSFTPFGEGPRFCIGLRFGKLQVKSALIAIMSRFQVSLSPNTDLTLKMNPNIFFTTPQKPIRLNISKRTDICSDPYKTNG